MQNIHVITGKPTLSSAAVMGIVLPHADEPPSVEHERDGNGRCTAVTTTYKRKGKLFGKRFSLEDAERAKLLGNTGWRHYPENMLELRSGVFAARKAFPDILSGIYSTEEIEQEPALPPEGGGRFSDETGSLSDSTKAVEPIPERLRSMPRRGRHWSCRIRWRNSRAHGLQDNAAGMRILTSSPSRY